ncbi:MAG: hypothetical protein Q8L92_11885, partial [Rubrivivax sp.]|nr:hypothetical protein [Rubrivivax sp.]
MLARQLRRELGLADDAAVAAFLGAAEALSASQPAPLAQALRGLRALLTRVDDAYSLYDRDQTLASRSLAISSSELLEANLRIRAEADAQARAVQSLREAVRELAQGGGEANQDSGRADIEG